MAHQTTRSDAGYDCAAGHSEIVRASMYTLLLVLFLTQVAAQPTEDQVVAAVTSLLQSDQTERALTLLQPFVKANPRARRAAVLLAFAYVRQGKYEQARV